MKNYLIVLLSVLLVALAWVFTKQADNNTGPPLFNYEGTQYYSPSKVLVPNSLHEIQSIVVEASKKGETVRPLGSGHNWQEFGHSPHTYLSLHNYRGLVKLDKLGRSASFKGGTRLWEINAILAEHDLALSILPAISNQTIAGAISTGTHGSGIKFGHLSTYVSKIQIVTGLGEVMNVSNKSDPGLFQAVGVSVGMLGIITQVTIRVEPIFNLLEVSESLTLSECMDNMETLRASYKHVKIWIVLSDQTCQVIGASRTMEQPSVNSNEIYHQLVTNIKIFTTEVIQWLLSVVPPLTDLVFTGELQGYKKIAVSWQIFTNLQQTPSSQRSGEVAVPLDKCQSAFRDIVELKHKLNIYINHVIEIRFVKKDSYWLSNSYNMDVCHITLLLYNPSDYLWNLYTESVYNATRLYGGRPHWGKSFTMDSTYLREVYPKYDIFMEYRRKLDPYEVFLTSDMKKMFGI